MNNAESSNNVIDEQTLVSISRKQLFEKDFSENNLIRKEQKRKIQESLNEPIRRAEFNVLAYVCNQDYQPYKNMRLSEESFCDYGTPKARYYVSVPQTEMSALLPLLSNNYSENKSFFNTLDFAFNRTRIVFRHKDIFKGFENSKFIAQDKLYNKLFGLTIENKIKVLYYFMYHYRYDFVDILKDYPKLYNTIEKIDDYFCFRGYHKRVTKIT